MRVFLAENEWYPVYKVTEEHPYCYFVDIVELTEEELKEFLEVYNKFCAWQNRLRKMVRKEE